MEIKYEHIKPIIVSETLEGSQMKVKFKALGQDEPIETVGMMLADQDEMMKSMKKNMVKQGAISIAISSIGTVLRNLIGGVGGSVASSAVSTAGSTVAMSANDPSKMMQAKDTPENRQKAVLSAFQSVQNFYEWDPNANVWKYKTPEIPKTEG